MRRSLIALASVALAAGAALTPAGSASAAACDMASCTGLDPSAAGTACNAASAQTYEAVKYRPYASARLSAYPVKLRWSNGCHAYWAGIDWYEFTASPASIRVERGTWIGSQFFVSASMSSPLTYRAGAYTPMLGAPSSGRYRYRACITTAGRTTCTQTYNFWTETSAD